MKNLFLKEIPDYFTVSLFSLGINLIVYGFLVYKGANYIIAAIIGFIIETIIAYLLNRFWTFSKTLIDFKIGYIRSSMVAILNLALILIITVFCVEILKLNHLSARIVAGIIVGVISFVFDAKFSFAVWPK